MESYEGKLGSNQARAFLHAPSSETLKGKRDLAIPRSFSTTGCGGGVVLAQGAGHPTATGCAAPSGARQGIAVRRVDIAKQAMGG